MAGLFVRTMKTELPLLDTDVFGAPVIAPPSGHRYRKSSADEGSAPDNHKVRGPRRWGRNSYGQLVGGSVQKTSRIFFIHFESEIRGGLDIGSFIPFGFGSKGR